MLSITIQREGISEYTWYLGYPRLPNFDLFPDVKDTYVQADGHELEYILRRIKGIPVSDARVQAWFGDDAKFIAFHFMK